MSIKAQRFGEDITRFWSYYAPGGDLYLVFDGTSNPAETRSDLRLGSMSTSKHYGFGDTTCHQVAADGWIVALPDQFSVVHRRYQPDPDWDPDWYEEENSLSVDLPDNQLYFEGFREFVNLGFATYNSKEIYDYSEYYNSDFSEVVGRVPVYRGVELKKDSLTFYSSYGSFERYNRSPDNDLHLSMEGQVIYSSIEDMLDMYPSSEGWFWEGMYRVRYLWDNPWYDYDDFPWFFVDEVAETEIDGKWLTYDKFEEQFSALETNLKFSLQRLGNPDWVFKHSKLCQKPYLSWIALDNLRYLSINSIAFLKDLKEIKDSLTPIIGVLRKPLSAKSWANLWLTYRYGIRLTIRDALDVVKAYDSVNKGQAKWQKPYATIRSRLSEDLAVDGDTYQLKMNCKVYYRPVTEGVDYIINLLRKWDLFPSLENLWDLIPYSFVVDWFIPVQEKLVELDKQRDFERFTLEYVLYSQKAVTELRQLGNYSHIQMCGSLKTYNRWRESSLSAPARPPGPEYTRNLAVQILDGTALVVQRRSKT